MSPAPEPGAAVAGPGAAVAGPGAVRVAVPVTTVWNEPSAVRPVDRPAALPVPDLAGWLAAMTLEDRLGLLGRSDTQALLGEPVIVIDEQPGWTQVVLPWQPSRRDGRGYPGWVPAAHLGTAPEGGDGVGTVVAALAPATTEGAAGSTLTLSYGTRLPVLEATADTVRLAAPDRTTLSLPRAAVRLDDPPALSGRAVLEAAHGFAGLLYLWAGCSAHGLDCSGLVHLTHRASGRVIPRDAGDQAAAGAAVPFDQARWGDLLFFTRPGETSPHHVAYQGAPGRMVHSPRTGRSVEDIDAGTSPYGEERGSVAHRYTDTA